MGISTNVRNVRDRFQPEGTSGVLLAGWLLSSILAIVIPVSKWGAERNRYFSYAGQYNLYEQQQRQYEEQANGNYGNNNYGGYSLCSWWNVRCRYRMKRWQQAYGNGNGGDNGGDNGDNAQMMAMLPDWYFFFGGSMQEDERDREEMGLGQNDGSMKFVYACTVIMFVALSIFGFRSMYAGQDRAGLIVALLIFGQFSLMNLLTTVQGTVETDGQMYENSVYGWYGQWSVLVAFTDFWLMLHCFVFAAFLGMLRCLDKRAERTVRAESAVVEMGYRQEDDDVMAQRVKYGMDA